jgi:transcriptional regulator with XRE-family HTH domain
VTALREDLGAAMRRLKRALELRMRADDRAERRREARGPRKASGALVSYDMRGLAARLRPALERDGRGWRLAAAEIGVTSPDLSRVMAGQDISAAKVFAICDWLGIDPRRFYRPLKGRQARCRHVRRPRAKMFHVKSTETEGGA